MKKIPITADEALTQTKTSRLKKKAIRQIWKKVKKASKHGDTSIKFSRRYGVERFYDIDYVVLEDSDFQEFINAGFFVAKQTFYGFSKEADFIYITWENQHERSSVLHR